jgi:hypothetical protein
MEKRFDAKSPSVYHTATAPSTGDAPAADLDAAMLRSDGENHLMEYQWDSCAAAAR